MKKESEDNIQSICDDCVNERKEKAQNYIKNNGINIDDYVKVLTKGIDGNAEYMWYCIKKVNKKTVNGKLSNIPIYKQKIKLGDNVNIKIEDIDEIGRFVE